jgi:hypothetical protein
VKPPPAPATEASLPSEVEPDVESADSSSPRAEGTPASPPAAQDTATSSEGRASSDACSVWPQINATKSVAEVKAFLAGCESGTYNTLAQARLSELERQDVAGNTVETEAEPKDEPKTPTTVDVGCKRFFPSIGKTITVPCGVEAQPSPPPEKEALLQSETELDPHPFKGRWSTRATVCDLGRGFSNADRLVFFGTPNMAQYQKLGFGYSCVYGSISKSPTGFKYTASCSGGYAGQEEKEGHLELDASGARLTGFGPDGLKLNLVSCDALAKTPPTAPAPEASTVSPDGSTKDLPEATRSLRKAADKGDASAMHNLGRMYEDGSGVAKDLAEAVRWYRAAADKGHASAMNALGRMFQFGLGVAQDEAEAVRWYRKAVEKEGHPATIFNLGVMYAQGRGVAQDEAEAVRWYRAAADKGHARAMYALGWMYDGGRGVAQDRRAAARHVFDALRLRDSLTVEQMTTQSSNWSKDFRRELQRLMKEAGVYDGRIDGSFGADMRRAIGALPAAG